MKRIFFHVQHLLGIGHVRRAAVLARTLAASGFDVLLVSGGAPLTLDLGGARFHQLPPVRARDEGLRELSHLDGTPGRTMVWQPPSTGRPMLRVEVRHAAVLAALPFPPNHKDPFDRLIVSQAIAEQMFVVSADDQLGTESIIVPETLVVS